MLTKLESSESIYIIGSASQLIPYIWFNTNVRGKT